MVDLLCPQFLCTEFFLLFFSLCLLCVLFFNVFGLSTPCAPFNSIWLIKKWVIPWTIFNPISIHLVFLYVVSVDLIKIYFCYFGKYLLHMLRTCLCLICRFFVFSIWIIARWFLPIVCFNLFLKSKFWTALKSAM